MKANELLEELLININGLEKNGFYFSENKIKEAIKELNSINIIVEDKRTLKDYVFTNCNECENRVDNKFTSSCFGCKRYYSCRFKLKKDK